jgi:hypothetical protein
MKNIKTYNDFILNEEISKRGFMTAALAGTLGIGAIGTGIANYRDKDAKPMEEVSSLRKDIPYQFIMKEKLLTIGRDFWITNDNRENFGKIEQRVLNFGEKFEYYDNTGKLEAIAQKEIFRIKSIVNVIEPNGNKIGRIEEEIFESIGNLFEGQNIYSIYDSNDKLIGKSKADVFIRNNVDIYNEKGDKVVAKFHTPLATIGRRWSSEIYDDSIDKRLLIFIPAYLSLNKSKGSSKK